MQGEELCSWWVWFVLWLWAWQERGSMQKLYLKLQEVFLLVLVVDVYLCKLFYVA